MNERYESLLGDKSCEELGLVKRLYCIESDYKCDTNAIVQNFSDVFKGFGTLPFTYKIQLKEGAQPVVHAPRRVPVPLREALKRELDRMANMSVIKKVQEPTDWVNSMVITKKKNDELRMCMDPKDLNENIKREYYQIPTREEIISEMAGTNYFTKLDASQGFWQLKLDESSTKYCTFNTPFGRYCFLRLPFGIKSAPEIFHRAMEQIIEGLEGVRVYIDDIIVWGSTLQEYKQRLNKVMERIQKYGLKLNRAKCEFAVQEILFLGDKLTAQGVQPDGDKVKAILNMPKPKDKTGVLRIMGMVNFIGKFIPNLTLPVSDTKSRRIAEVTSHDTELQRVIQNMDEGWPAGSCPRYYHVQGDLSFVDGLLLKKGRIVIPEALRPDLLNRIHEGHLGIEKCKRRARESVYWPGLNKDIEMLVSKCETCQKHQSKQTKESMVISESPAFPWHKVGMDLFHLKGKDYLVVMDYFSNFPEMALLLSTTSACVITLSTDQQRPS